MTFPSVKNFIEIPTLGERIPIRPDPDFRNSEGVEICQLISVRRRGPAAEVEGRDPGGSAQLHRPYQGKYTLIEDNPEIFAL
jgi:hypothetical protein